MKSDRRIVPRSPNEAWKTALDGSARVLTDARYLAVFYALVLASLWLARGHALVGWELVGAAHGKKTFAEQGFTSAFLEFMFASRNFFYWSSTNSVLFGLVPGALSYYFPSLYWGAIVNISLVLAALMFCLWREPIHRRAFFAAAACSPALLSFTIVGYPYLSGVIPYALALYFVFARYRKPLSLRGFALELVFWAAVTEISFHCYELGKSFFLVPLIAAVALTGITLGRRFIWILVSGILAYWVQTVRSANVDYLLSGSEPILIALGHGVLRVAESFFIDCYVDLPVLFVLGVAACVLVREERWFWRLLFASQLCLITLGGAQGEDFLRPRRVLLFLFVCALLIGWVWRYLPDISRARRVFAGALLAGQLMTITTVYRFLSDPPENRSLPFTQSQVDFYVDRGMVADSEVMSALSKGEHSRQVFLYGYSQHAENSTDPVALPERLYLATSDEVFDKKFSFFDDSNCRHSCVKYSSRSMLVSRLLGLDGPFLLHTMRDEDSKWVEHSLLNRSSFSVVELSLKNFVTYSVTTFSEPGPVQVPVLDAGLPALVDTSAPCAAKGPAERVRVLFARGAAAQGRSEAKFALPIDHTFSEPASLVIEGWTEIGGRSARELNIEGTVDDEIALFLNDVRVVDMQGQRDWTQFQATSTVRPGPLHLKVLYSNLNNLGVLRLRMAVAGEEDLSFGCADSSAHTKLDQLALAR